MGKAQRSISDLLPPKREAAMHMGMEVSMAMQFVLSEYVEQAMAQATYEKLEDGTYSGRIPSCKGAVAFGPTLRECEDNLHSALEDWILLGLKMRHALPVIGHIDLNKEPVREPVDAV